MYNVLLVDDEGLLRRGLSALIPWNELHCRLVGEASNGQEALHILADYSVDIVITDIRMPFMDGITFMEKVRTQYSDVKIIILSGYDDFKYAMAALQNGAGSYVLKPVIKEEIVEAISKSILQINKEREFKQIRTDYLNLERQLVLQKVVKRTLYYNEETREQFEKLGINFSGGYFCVGVAELIKNMNEYDDSVRESIRNRLIYILDAKYSLCEEVFFLEDSRICLIIGDNHRGFDAECVFFEIRKLIHEYFDINVVLGFGCNCIGEEIGKSYVQAVEALKFSINYPSDTVISYEKLLKVTENKLPPNYPFQEERELLAELTTGTEETITQAFEAFYRKIFDNTIVNEDVVQQVLTELIVSVKRYLIGYSVERTFDSGKVLKALRSNKGLEQGKNLLLSSMIAANGLLIKNKKSTGRDVVEKAKAFIEQNLSQKITLERVIDKVFVSKSYFCKIFKDETGLSFKNYVNHARIEKAKKLLKDNKYKNYEISYMVGFEDPAYFNELFKRKTGLTPLEYKKL